LLAKTVRVGSCELCFELATGGMSTEYLERRPYDRRSDVWTLGVVLWELLTGLRLFRKESDGATFAAILCEPVARPSEFAKSIDGRLDAVVAKAVARRVDERCASAYDMAQNLEAYPACTGGAVEPADVGGWLRDILQDSLPTLTSLMEATRARGVSPQSARIPLGHWPEAAGPT
jgi:serine/threonine protein kinase